MKNNAKKILKAGVVLFIAVLFVATSATAIGKTPEKTTFTSTKQTATLFGPSRDEVELKYYNEENLTQVIGIQGGTGPYIWKTAIKLTQMEMGTYTDWNLTKVNVAMSADNGCPSIDVRIYIYDKGTATKPGVKIVNDTTYTLDTTGVTTIPLVTAVPLNGHEELWVAVQWTQYEPGPGVYYAWLDTLTTGGAVDGKGDWYYLNNVWGEIQTGGADYDGNWGIGAIVEGEGGIAELSVLNIKGPIGIKADVQNIGEKDASNLEWSIVVTGGLLGRVNATATGTAVTLAAGATAPMSLEMFFGFGKISIVITASASNAVEVSATKSAFLLGPFVVGIK